MMPWSHAAGSGVTNMYLADVSLCMAAGAAPFFNVAGLLISEFNNGGQPYDALVGRDLICRGIFTINFTGRFTFSI
jgi:hypothetical protein